MTTRIVSIAGDGIGPEVTRAMKMVVAATGAPIEWIDMEAGADALVTHGSTLPAETLGAIDRYRLAIKGPTRTPLGEGHESANVALRRHFDLFAGVRPCTSLPFPQPQATAAH